MGSTWDETALTLESVEVEAASPPTGRPVRWEDTGAWSGADEQEASVGQWLSNIGSGAASGAATGLVAGPWGALVGGLLGGGLGAAQTAAAPRAPAPPRPAPPPHAPPPPAPPPPTPAAARPPAPPHPQPAPRPAVALRPPAPVTGASTAQLLDQLASLVPVVAALAVQVGSLTQVVQGGAVGAAPAPVGQETVERPGGAEDGDDTAGGGESGEDAADEAVWPQTGGEWTAAEDRDWSAPGSR